MALRFWIVLLAACCKQCQSDPDPISIPVSVAPTYRQSCYNLTLEETTARVFHSQGKLQDVLSCEDPYVALLYGVLQQGLALCSGYAPVTSSEGGPLFKPIPDSAHTSRWLPSPTIFDDQIQAINSLELGGVATQLPSDCIYIVNGNATSADAVLPLSRDSLEDDAFFNVLSSPGCRFLQTVIDEESTDFIQPVFRDWKVIRLVLLAFAGAVLAGLVIWAFEHGEPGCMRRLTHHKPEYNKRSVFGHVYYAVCLVVSMDFDGKQPHTRLGRYCAIMWKYITILLFASLNARVLLSMTLDTTLSSKDLYGSTIGVVKGSNEDYQMSASGAIVQTYPSITHAVDALSAGDIPTLAVDSLIASFVIQQARDQGASLRAVGELQNKHYVGVLLSEKLSNRSSINLQRRRFPLLPASDPSNAITFKQCFQQSLFISQPLVKSLVSSWLGNDASTPVLNTQPQSTLGLRSASILAPLVIASIMYGFFVLYKTGCFFKGVAIRHGCLSPDDSDDVSIARANIALEGHSPHNEDKIEQEGEPLLSMLEYKIN